MKKRIKILTIFGTRPEAIKLAPVITKLHKNPDRFNSLVCVTGQHRKMLDQVLNLFKIKPDYDLNIMEDNQTLFDLSCNVLIGLRGVMEKEEPNLILVQGDTTTTFVAGLAAYYLKIPIGHIEAGLRTGDRFNPFPEEMNRRLTTHLADLHFSPTLSAKESLMKEGINEDKIFVTGNTVIDAVLMVVEEQSRPQVEKKWISYFEDKFGISLNNKKIILVTGHRRESFGKGFENICFALKKIAVRNRGITLIYPVHLNPNVQKTVKKLLGGIKNIHLIEPLDYHAFVFLMSKSYVILTDSGGVQEEAPSLGKPVLIMRKVTERPEAVKAGTSKLVGTDIEKIIDETENFLNNREYYNKVSHTQNPYGDGLASGRIVKIIIDVMWM